MQEQSAESEVWDSDLAYNLCYGDKATYDAEFDSEPFETPRCPKCLSSEVVLDAVANGNSWRGDFCGKSWIEAPAVANEAR